MARRAHDDCLSSIGKLLTAVGEGASAARLKPANCAKHVTGLPHDVTVARIDIVRHQTVRPYQLVNFGEEELG